MWIGASPMRSPVAGSWIGRLFVPLFWEVPATDVVSRFVSDVPMLIVLLGGGWQWCLAVKAGPATDCALRHKSRVQSNFFLRPANKGFPYRPSRAGQEAGAGARGGPVKETPMFRLLQAP